jgi:phosphatidate cytidylyltransferase
MTAAPARSNLYMRVVTALVMAAVVIGTLATASTPLWAALVTLFCLAAVWESTRLMRGGAASAMLVTWGVSLALLGALAYCAFSADRRAAPVLPALLSVAAAFWLLVAPRQLVARRIDMQSWHGRLVVPLVIGAAWLSAIVLQRVGMGFLIGVVVITVVADVAAYFVGRKFGKVKLAPAISPGKTREGAMGGVAAAAIWTCAVASYLGLTNTPLESVLAGLAGALLGAFAVVGDLWESQLKRQAGVKDSSQLLPGHGGVLDRIDAQLPVLPLATLLVSLVKPLW